MPFKSQAQRAFMYAKHPKMAEEFESKTPEGKKLPKHVKKFHKMLKGGIMEIGMNLFIPITKYDEEQRMVYGIATCSKLDNQNEIVDWEATKSAVADYSNWRNIREMHKPSAVGTAPVLELRDNSQELYIGAKIIDASAWEKCKEGVYKGFSIGGDKLDQRVEMDKVSGKTVNRITKYNLNEISLVDRPANPNCRFQTVKRDSSVHVITITEDPLKGESARVMEKALLIAKKTLTKEDLEKLPDTAFGLIKITEDGDTLIKKRDYPIPDKVHAINMIRKSVGDPISDIDKERVHNTALLVLGKKHVETECPYCILKLKGGVVVEKKVEKSGSVVVTHEPNKRIVEIQGDGEAGNKEVKPIDGKPINGKPVEEKVPGAAASGAPVEEKKPPFEEEAEVGAAPVEGTEAGTEGASTTDAKLDRIISLLEGALGGEETGEEQEPVAGEEQYEEEALSDVVNAAEETPIKTEEDADAIADVKNATEAPIKTEEDACSKVAPAKTVKKGAQNIFLSKQLKSILEPLAKENKELKARIEKMEKQPLPRKDAKAEDKAVKVEKYQDVKLEKKESTFSEALTKDIEKAQELRITKGINVTKEEDAFCQRVAKQMLEEKLSK
jgi:hypothetical protein